MKPSQLFLFATKRRAKRRGPKPRVFGRVHHRARPAHKGRHPVHITLRARHGLPSFRQQLVHALILRVLRDQRRRAYGATFQIVHFSIQSNHVHMIVEADDGPLVSSSSTKGPSRKTPLRSGVSGFVIAFAKRLNAMFKRKGKVWDDRYHRHDLESPHEVKTSVRYVINNFRKHGHVTFGMGAFDYYSSAQHFDGWSEGLFAQFREPEPWTETAPRTWLLAQGWKVHGLISPLETPGRRPR
jgi:REP element-mobilizing transposase RayT